MIVLRTSPIKSNKNSRPPMRFCRVFLVVFLNVFLNVFLSVYKGSKGHKPCRGFFYIKPVIILILLSNMRYFTRGNIHALLRNLLRGTL